MKSQPLSNDVTLRVDVVTPPRAGAGGAAPAGGACGAGGFPRPRSSLPYR